MSWRDYWCKNGVRTYVWERPVAVRSLLLLLLLLFVPIVVVFVHGCVASPPIAGVCNTPPVKAAVVVVIA